MTVSATGDPLSTDAEPASHPHAAAAAAGRHGRGLPAAATSVSSPLQRPDLDPPGAAYPGRGAQSSPGASAGIRSTSRTSSRGASARRSTSIRRRGDLPLRRPSLPGLRQDDRPPERGRARRLRRPRLPRHAPGVDLRPGQPPVPPLRGERAVPEQLFSKGSGLPALRGARRPLRLLLPDPRQDRLQARRDRGRSQRGPFRRRSSATSPT